MAENQQPAGEQNNPAQQFALQRIFIKDLSFEVPMGAQVFTKQWQPQVHVDLNTKSDKVADDIYEAVLTITITAKLGQETAFLVEVQQAGLFLVKGVDGDQLRRVLMIMCPNILFPYARETVDSLTTRGSFPPIMLQPVNFEALYMQALAQAEQKSEGNNAH
jgi:preprotein translocase subunit SecB